MSISDISNVFTFIGGLGMFLFGMENMADGMQKSAGNKMRSFLGMLTNNRLMAVALGALITAIIQSSGATTVMVVGFVSAGLLNLGQAVGVIMGANIGTTITAWIVSMSQLGDAFTVLKPGFYAPCLIGIGAMLIVFGKTQKRKTIGEILIGLGLLFMGLDLMSGSISPYTDAPIFAKAFEVLGGNPLLGMLIGALVTALLQSSSASVGILQTLAMNGIVTTNAVIYITLGQNMGSCVTALISGIGGSRTAKRAAVMHLTFNVIGAILVGTISFVFFAFRSDIAFSDISAVQISMFHTVFNLSMTALLFPFADQLVRFSGVIIKDRDGGIVVEQEETGETIHLDERIFESPTFAIETAILEVVHMGRIAGRNLEKAIHILLEGDMEEAESVYKIENTINNMEQTITNYLIKVNNLSLTEKQKKIVNNLFYSISDIARVGDHTVNVVRSVQALTDRGRAFSDMGKADLTEIGESVLKTLDYAVTARETGNMDAVRKVAQYEYDVDTEEEEMREKHINRLSANQCDSATGAIFLDVISNLKRIAEHAYAVAGYVKDEM
ncbi:MAG: Na/Pi cotransporter family protein [Clostridiales bacterium]|nr:Na/Pi cotransporter family protein [Clostridiales bacterium]